MSFMAGFGEAFSRSFENQRERSERRKDDLFKMTYDNYLKRKKDYDDAKKEDTRMTSKAKSFVEATGQPPEAWTKVYEWLRDGMDDTWIENKLTQGKFSVTQRGNETQVSEDVVRPSPIETQTSQMMGAPMQQPIEAPQPEKPNRFKQLFKNGPNLLGDDTSYEDRLRTGALDRTAQVTGSKREDIETVLGGYTPQTIDSSGVQFTPGAPERKADPLANLQQATVELGEAEVAYQENPTQANKLRYEQAQRRMKNVQRAEFMEANAKALANGFVLPGTPVKLIDGDGDVKFGYATRGPNGEILVDGEPVPPEAGVQPVTEDEQKEYTKLAGDLAPRQEEYNKKVVAMTGVMREAGGMAALVDQTGGAVLSSRIGNFAGWAQGMAGEVATGFAILERLKQSDQTVGQDPAEVLRVEEMEKQINDMISSGVNDVGTARNLYEAKVKILAYKLAMIEGQSGRALSETERQIFEKLAEGGNSPQKFDQAMANLIFPRLDALATEASLFNSKSVQQDAFMKRFNWKKPPFEPAVNPEEFIVNDPDLKTIYDRFRPHYNLTIRNPAKTPQDMIKGDQPSQGQIVRPPNTQDQKVLMDWYTNIPPGTRYIDPNGVERTKGGK